VWGDAPLTQSRRSLQSHLSRIRRVLDDVAARCGPNAGGTLHREAGGYAIASAEEPSADSVRRSGITTTEIGRSEMASLGKKLQDLAKDPKAKKLADKAREVATDPNNRQKVSLVRERLRRRPR
jgi:hypothetical protein